MKYLKKYNKFIESLVIDLSLVDVDIIESLSILSNVILDSINAEEVNIYDTLKIKEDEFADKLNLDVLTNNADFVNSLSNIGLKKSNVESSEDFQTFISKPCRFILIYKQESNELENPVYIIFQSWNDTLKEWGEVKTYSINGDIKKFYDKLSSKVIEVDDNGEKYIYNSSNGNEWVLQNPDKENDTFKKYLRTEEFEEMVKDNKVKISII